MKEIIAQKKWVYTLYRDNENFIFPVVCGGAGMFNVDIPLTDLDIAEFNKDPDFLNELAEKIRNNPKAYNQMKT